MELTHARKLVIDQVVKTIDNLDLAPNATHHLPVAITSSVKNPRKEPPVGAWIGQVVQGNGDSFKQVIYSIGNLKEHGFNLHIHSGVSNRKIKLTNVQLKIFLLYSEEDK